MYLYKTLKINFEKIKIPRKKSECSKLGTRLIQFEIYFFSKFVDINHVNALKKHTSTYLINVDDVAIFSADEPHTPESVSQ